MDRRKYDFPLVLGRPSKQPIKIKSSEGRREKKSLDSLPRSHTLSLFFSPSFKQGVKTKRLLSAFVCPYA